MTSVSPTPKDTEAERLPDAVYRAFEAAFSDEDGRWRPYLWRQALESATAVLAASPAVTEGERGGAALIAAERQRQVDAEGWTPQHDQEHTTDALARAAACYATPPRLRSSVARLADGQGDDRGDRYVRTPAEWPWHPDWWKPTDDRIRELVKAGALIAAEIDRLLPASPAVTAAEDETVPKDWREQIAKAIEAQWGASPEFFDACAESADIVRLFEFAPVPAGTAVTAEEEK